jgi:translation elongation factor EF-Tu-like GTPase
MDAKFEITDSFIITQRGIVLCGFIKEGTISINDEITFNFNKKNITRKIIGVEDFRTVPQTPTVGIIINFENESETEEFKNWKPDGVISLITKQIK